MSNINIKREYDMDFSTELGELSPEVSKIESAVIKSLVVKALNNVNKRFWVEPASSTGKYHPEYSLGEGGLVRHVKSAVFFATTLLELEQFQNKFTEFERDCIVAALILHDTCKSGINWENSHTVHEHPTLVKHLIDEDELSESEQVIWGYINNLIETHMGQWNINKHSESELKKPVTEAQEFVHMCDYLSSRKNIDVLIFSDKIKEELVEVKSWKDDPMTDKQQYKIKELLRGLNKETLQKNSVEINLIKSVFHSNKATKGWANSTINYLLDLSN